MRMLKYILPLLLLGMASCSVQKRVYRAGFYFGDINHGQTNTVSGKAPEKQIVTPKKVVIERIEKKPLPVYASIEKGVFNSGMQKDIFTENCDTIFFRSGKRSVVKILEVDQSEVKYKLCNSADSPLFTLELSKIDSITFSNGSTESYQHVKPVSKPKSPVYETPESEQIRKAAKVTLILGIISAAGVLFFGPVGIVFAILALEKGRSALSKMLKRERDYLKEYQKTRAGMNLARFALIFGLAVLAFLAFIILLTSHLI